MVSSKREITDIEPDSKKRTRSRSVKLICWLFVDAAVAAVIIGLLLHKPGMYDPAAFDAAGHQPGQVSRYLTHDLSPQIYNGAQREEPFDLIITQKGINEIVAGWGWPKMSRGVMLYSPSVLFTAGSVVMMATAEVRGAEFIITIEIQPGIDDKGMLNCQVSKVKVGAMNVTLLARITAERMYAQKMAEFGPIDPEDFQTRIVESLLNGAPFEPVFKVDGRKLRVKSVKVEKEKIVAHLIPAP